MIFKGTLLCLGSTQGGQSCLQACCHNIAASTSVAATATTTTTQAICHCGRAACCGRLACCSRGVVGGGGGASSQGCCSCVSLGSLPCFSLCPRATTYSAISLIGLSTFLLFQQQVELILTWLLDSGDAESFLFFLLLFTFMSFPMTWGYILVNVVAGYRFGLAFGTLVVIVCVAIGSTLAFLVCRMLLSEWIRSSLLNEKLEAIIRVVEGDHGFQVIALTRLTPIPFGIQNGVFAMSRVPVTTFMLASFLGLLPTQCLNSYMGSSLRSIQDIKNHQSSSLLLLAQVLFSFLLSLYVLRVAQRELHKKLDSHHHLPVSLVQVTSDAHQCNQVHGAGNHSANHIANTNTMKPLSHAQDSASRVTDHVYIV